MDTQKALSPREAETWAQIVDDCRSHTQSSINVGSNKRRAAILAVNAMLSWLNSDANTNDPAAKSRVKELL